MRLLHEDAENLSNNMAFCDCLSPLYILNIKQEAIDIISIGLVLLLVLE
jgi:hypothetical protein